MNKDPESDDRPLPKAAAPDAPDESQRLGFLAGEIAVSDDFDRMGEAEILALFVSEGS